MKFEAGGQIVTDKCPNCGARMIPMITSSVCSAECDLKPAGYSRSIRIRATFPPYACLAGHDLSAYVGLSLVQVKLNRCLIRGATMDVDWEGCRIRNGTIKASTLKGRWANCSFEECLIEDVDATQLVLINNFFSRCYIEGFRRAGNLHP